MQKCRRILLVGPPNVGKSLIFYRLTGAYAFVSNYPGTTVEISHSWLSLGDQIYEVIDTPGMYSLYARTEEERVARETLFSFADSLVIQVLDGKNLIRMLPQTYELIDGGFSVLLVINMMDEAKAIGISIDVAALSQQLKIPVISGSAFQSKDMKQLKQALLAYKKQVAEPVPFSPILEQALNQITQWLPENFLPARRLIAYLLLQQDITALYVYKNLPKRQTLLQEVQRTREELTHSCSKPPSVLFLKERGEQVAAVTKDAITYGTGVLRRSLAPFLAKVTREEKTGLFLAFIILFGGLYEFVGRFGAGWLVDTLDRYFFQDTLLPYAMMLLTDWGVNGSLQTLLVGDFGVLSLGLRYAVAIVLPIMATFFFFFAFLEDTGYLSRLALLTNRFFSLAGLNGRFAIPFFVGFGCGTLAVLSTRILTTKRERRIAAFLLMLAIPCSAQLGLIIALLSLHRELFLYWFFYMILLFVGVGSLLNLCLPGRKVPFLLELAPLRLPHLKNIICKTSERIKGYFSEMLPLFLAVSILLSLLELSGKMSILTTSMAPIVTLLGLPPQMGPIFLLGFIRRDYGAAGIYDLYVTNHLNEVQLLTAAVTFTVFLPCLAQFALAIREQGLVLSCCMAGLIFLIALGSGLLVKLFFA
ncbi:MAG: ferrous iron transport protein B [Sporomusaceae bacterium]|nr:ferrous iron transport protein B [Sporomusaceae bacterium]